MPGESSCPGGSEYVWQRRVGVLKAELRPAEVDPRFKIWPWPIVLSKIKDNFGPIAGAGTLI